MGEKLGVSNESSILNDYTKRSPEECLIVEKDGKIQKVCEGIRKDLSEFDILKLATAEFDKFKNKLNNLGLPDNFKDKIMNNATSLFYSKDNDKNKLKGIIFLNYIIDTINENKNNIGVLYDRLQNELEDALTENTSISEWIYLGIKIFLVGVFIYLLSNIEGPIVGISSMILVGSAIMFLCYEKKSLLVDKNKLFDTINDIFPQINKEEFEKIYNLHKDGQFKKEKFIQMIIEYEKDGKITSEERKKIDEFLGIK